MSILQTTQLNIPEGMIDFGVGQPSLSLLPLAEARRRDVSFQPGPKFSSAGGLRNFLRLSFAYYNTEALLEGVTRLAQVIIK